MIFVGLTGVLGSGKSTVARLLQERGCDIIDIDGLARDSLNWKETQDDIREAFGIEYVVDGKVDVVKVREAKTVQGQSLTVNATRGVKVDGANVVKTDILASNGVIHVIDSVVLPR